MATTTDELAQVSDNDAEELAHAGQETEARPRCQHCGKASKPANRRQRYCKPAHRVAAYEARKRKLQTAGA